MWIAPRYPATFGKTANNKKHAYFRVDSGRKQSKFHLITLDVGRSCRRCCCYYHCCCNYFWLSSLRSCGFSHIQNKHFIKFSRLITNHIDRYLWQSNEPKISLIFLLFDFLPRYFSLFVKSLRCTLQSTFMSSRHTRNAKPIAFVLFSYSLAQAMNEICVSDSDHHLCDKFWT